MVTILSMIWIQVSLLGLVIAAESANVAISSRLSKQLCNYVDSSRFQRVSPGSPPGSVCPVYEKDGSQNRWMLNSCRRDSAGEPETRPWNGAPEDDNGSSNGGKRLIDARNAPPFSHPYVAYFRHKEVGASGLSGTIYNRYTIIVNTPQLKRYLKEAGGVAENLRIHIGKHKHLQRENEEQLRFMCNYTIHPKYDDSQENTIYYYSAVHLYDPITIGRFADKVPFAAESQRPTISKECIIPGWGEDGSKNSPHTSDTLKEADAVVKDKCDGPDYPNHDHDFCTNPVYCWADTGSPLICTDNHRVYASGLAASRGLKTSEPCKTSKNTMYADLKFADVLDWIEKTYQDHKAMCRPSLRLDIPNS